MNSAINPSLCHVTLLLPHTHEGKACGGGESIAVDATTAQWLVQHGIARTVQDAAANTPSPTSKLVKDSK